MPKFPEFLYQLQSGDSGTLPLEQVMARLATTPAASPSVSRYAVPGDKVLILESAGFIANGGVNNVTSWTIALEAPTGTQQLVLDGDFPGYVAGGQVKRFIYPHLFVPPKWSVLVVATYSAGVANSHTHYLKGILIPRGSFS